MDRGRSSAASGASQDIKQHDEEVVNTPKRVSEFINEERRKASSPGRNSAGSQSFLGSEPSTPNSKKNETEGDKKNSTPTKVKNQADVTPSGLTTIAEKKKREKKRKGKKIEVPEYRQDPIGTWMVDNIYYISSFII